MKSLFCFLLVAAMFPSAIFSQSTNNTLTAKEKKNGWILLFNGVNSEGWTTTKNQTVPAGWEVKEGTINTVKSGKGGDIMSVNEYSDFDLSIDYKIESGCNSGVKYFFTQYEKGGNLGMEYQILDNELAEDNKLANHLSGSFYDVLPPAVTKPSINAPGEWNTLRIVAKGKNVAHWLNGVKILEFIRGSKAFTDAVSLSKFSKTSPAFGTVDKGHIMLQEHGGVVSFKNIKIKLL
jgi:Domain of Unknown Function (DUF1080)